jgi:triacylglycerol lipase
MEDAGMSFLVEIDESAYPRNALDKFSASPSFTLDDARAMMWMSQLAYETAFPTKITNVLGRFNLSLKDLAGNNPSTRLPPNSACFVAAAGRDATIIAFAGTDPLSIQDWIIDFTAAHSPDDLHQGFKNSVDAVWGKISPVIQQRANAEKKLFFTGHSLGGALAIIAAERAMRELGSQATAVYTFGGPRVGGLEFFNRYGSSLGDSTFRLVHGSDLVAAVPPTIRGDFLHVGHCVHISSGDHFEDQTPRERIDLNNPDLVKSALQSAIATILFFAIGHPQLTVGPRLLDQLAIALPPMVKDHVPANYFRALSIPLK